MRTKYLRMTVEGCREWWKSCIEDIDCEDEIVGLLPHLSDLQFIEAHADLGLAFELATNYQRALALWERTGPMAKMACSSPTTLSWLRECVSSVIDGKPDPHANKGAGPVLSALVRELDRKTKQFYSLGEHAIYMALLPK